MGAPLLIARPRTTLTVILAADLLVGAQPVLLQQDWLGWFPATMGTFLLTTVWSSVVTCTAAAYLACGIRRHKLSDWVRSSARGVRGGYGQPLLVCGALGAFAYTISFVVMVTMTLARAAEPVASSLLGLLAVLPLAWVSAFAWAAVGVTLARFTRPEAAVPLALVISYATFIIPVFYLSETPLLGIALDDGRRWVTLRPTVWQILSKILFWGGVAVLFASLATAARRRTAEAGAWTCVAGLTAMAFLGSTLVGIPGSEDRVCHGGVPRVCTDRAHVSVLPTFEAAVSDSVAVLPEMLRPRLVDDAEGSTPELLPLAPVDGFTSPAFTVDREQTVAALGQGLFGRCLDEDVAQVDPHQRAVQAETTSGLEVWWRLENGVSVDDPVVPGGAAWLTIPELAGAVTKGKALATLSPPAQQAWFDQNAPAIVRCDLADVEWP